MKFIVTGHRGWIGRHVCRLLDERGIKYQGFDRKINYDLNSPEGHREFEYALTDADAVIHLAARPRIPASWASPADYIKDNIELTEYIARTCPMFGVPIVFASSSSVYGNGDGPLNPYSWSKLAGEQILETYGRSLNLNYKICRIFTCYGEDAPHGDKGLVLGNWLHAKLNNKPILIRGSGDQRRDFVHVTDVARALIIAARSKAPSFTIDLGTGENHSLNEIAEMFGCEIVREHELCGYATHTLADPIPAVKMLGWTANHNLPEWVATVCSSTKTDV